MKNLFLISFLLLSINAFSQFEYGIGAGISSKGAIGNIQAGYFAADGYLRGNHFYYNQLIHLGDNSTSPQILGVRYGYTYLLVEPSIGLDYHILSNIKENDSNRGWHMAYGLSFKAIHWMLTGGISGNIKYVTIGIYK